ncbi:MAG TPA: cobaltochelatase subunit CobN, partial [Acidimicrobiia bacterium]
MILFVTNVDTEILALRTALEALPASFGAVRAAQPWTVDGVPDLSGVRCVLVRLLRGRQAWPDGFDALRAECAARTIPFLAFGGEAVPDAELTALSSVPSGIVTEAFAYLVNGGPKNFEHLLRFVADTVLLEGFGFDAPTEIPAYGVWRMPTRRDLARPLVAVVFYRAHLVAGNTQFVEDLCDALEAVGADAIAWWCYSLRDQDAAGALVALVHEHDVDAVITTILAAGGMAAGAGTTGRPGGLDGETWDVGTLAALDRPIIQAPSSGTSRAAWEASAQGLG